MVTDAELLNRWRGGDNDAGRQLFEGYYDPIVRFFRNKLSSNVADLVQETFIACVEGRDRLRQDASFRSYLFATAHNVLRGYLRSTYRRHGEIDFDEVAMRDLSPSPSAMASQRQEERLLLEALRSIPVGFQVVLELRYWEDLKTHEIAEILALPQPTARSRLRRARERLEAAMAKLARSPHELHSTLSNLDSWARSCREQLGRID